MEQSVEGDQLVKGSQIVRGNQTVRGYPVYKIVGMKHIGSRNNLTQILYTKHDEITIRCGCFFGTIDEFERRVKQEHKDNIYYHEYMALITYARTMYPKYKELAK